MALWTTRPWPPAGPGLVERLADRIKPYAPTHVPRDRQPETRHPCAFRANLSKQVQNIAMKFGAKPDDPKSGTFEGYFRDPSFAAGSCLVWALGRQFDILEALRALLSGETALLQARYRRTTVRHQYFIKANKHGTS